MKKKNLSFGDHDITIAELNTAQVEELVTFEAPAGEESAAAWKGRMWRTILLAVNNAQAPPNRDNPHGSDSQPHSRADLEPTLGYTSVQDLHNEVLKLSGLKPKTAGE